MIVPVLMLQRERAVQHKIAAHSFLHDEVNAAIALLVVFNVFYDGSAIILLAVHIVGNAEVSQIRIGCERAARNIAFRCNSIRQDANEISVLSRSLLIICPGNLVTIATNLR